MRDFEYLAYDIEANGYVPNTIFCICMTDLLTMKSRTFYGDEIADACVILGEATMVVGHYIRGYDCPVIERLTEGMIKFSDQSMVDTLDMSKKIMKGQKKHSLEYWGNIFGLPKLKQPLFEHFDIKLLPYCERDVAITVKLFYYLLERYLDEGSGTIFRNHQALDDFVSVISRTAEFA